MWKNNKVGNWSRLYEQISIICVIGAVLGSIPTHASNSKHYLDKELQTQQTPSASDFLTQEQPIIDEIVVTEVKDEGRRQPVWHKKTSEGLRSHSFERGHCAFRRRKLCPQRGVERRVLRSTVRV
jgi:hypothetical protein